MAFSSDAKYIITQSGAPDWTLYYWTWEKTKMMASIKTAGEKLANNDKISNVNSSLAGSQGPGTLTGAAVKDVFGTSIYQISFNPTDNTQLCVVGNGIFKLLRYSEGTLKPLNIQKIEPRVMSTFLKSQLLLNKTKIYRIFCVIAGQWTNESL
jgi:cilia- and flagella-associated protein 57